MKSTPHRLAPTLPTPEPDVMGRWMYPVVLLTPVILVNAIWPLRNAALVIWIYGTTGYQQGIRVHKGKPVRFNNGAIPPTGPDIITGFGAFLVSVCLSFGIMSVIKRLYERMARRSAPRNP